VAAIDGIAEGDVIELTDGVFTGDGNRDIYVEERDFTIRSQSGDYERCVIDVQGSEADQHFGFLIAGEGPPSVVLDGLTIRPWDQRRGAGWHRGLPQHPGGHRRDR
jgi:hypothetical protein